MIDPRKGIEEVCQRVMSGDVKNMKALMEEFHKKVLDYFYEDHEMNPDASQVNMMTTLFSTEYNKLASGVDWMSHRGRRGPGHGAGPGGRDSLASVSFDRERVQAGTTILAALRAMKGMLCRLTMASSPTPLQFRSWDTTNIMETLRKQIVETLESLLTIYNNVKSEDIKQNYAQHVTALRDLLKQKYQ